MQNSDNNVSLRLREERHRLKMTQQESADCCGVAKKTFERWEAGTPISSDMLVKLADNGFNVIYLLFGAKGISANLSVNEAPASYDDTAFLSSINSSNSAELAGIGREWWRSVSSLSQDEQNAVLTLVFGSSICKQINLAKDSDK